MPDQIIKSLFIVVISAMLFAGTASAADQQELYIKSLAASCANCHGTYGKSITDAALPALAGMKSINIIEQMQAFKTGTRQATIMHQIAKGYTDDQIKLLANYFAAQN